ncbi:SH3 domain-containing protein [Microbacterium sp. ARD31]|uniref:SH3 domain-containing protein n=1 Tax=Microbacterium sp. ARD31 TaxID=2962576 RepID=UPI0028819249|nr:SH3 domain-containing protein [Microbacterium sp. ARD31]MDT0183332.1 SH3 domain-containing protein [Microbacterium sp. ARD31]
MTVRTKIAAMTAALTVVISLVGAGSASAAEPIATGAPAAVAASPEAPTGIVKTADLSAFDPGNIVSDAVFFNESTMTEAQIQAFLEKRVPSCQAGYTCLKDWYDTSRTTTADAMCGAYSGGTRERAARIIFKVAQACGINPQVILVTLQKEQGLVTHTWPSDWRYTIAMGQGCPDTAACDTRYYGFFNQVYGAAWQLKRYANPAGTSQFFTWYAPGKTWNILFNPNHGCGTSPVYVQNQATSNLYYYTPYQPNAAAIRAGYGEGDGCSAYGNRNFFNYFTDWFGSTQGDPCAEPPGSVAASWTYTAIDRTTARTAPNDDCKAGAAPVYSGDIGKAVAASADGQWRKLSTATGEKWVPAEDLRRATSEEAPCAASTTAPASWTYVLTADVLARSAPSAGCELGTEPLAAGVVVKSVATSADGQWRRVQTETGERWVPFDLLQRATTAEASCRLTPSVPASWTYTVTAATTGRVAPNSGCEPGAAALAAGTVGKAVAASADLAWRKLSTTAGELWVPANALRRSTTAEAACAQPVGTLPATWTYAIDIATTGRAVPNATCATGASTLSAGTIATSVAASADGAWQRLQTESGLYWVERTSIRRADAGETACAAQPGSVPASWRYVTTAEAPARISPAQECGLGAGTVAAGTVVPAVAASADLLWRKVRTAAGERWILASQLRKATTADLACLPPTGTISSTWTFVALVPTTARSAPNALCGAGAVDLPAGTIAKAVAVTADGAWRKLRTTAGDLWVPMSDIHHVRMATTATANLRSGPSTTTKILATLPKGTKVVVIGVSGLWREVTVGTRTGWIRGDYLD